jgi:F0F1-type ATP synthase membrane subunit b/b'|tara:strand:- start:78 stop:473 length:396 start_codon:yes stop_codon:yes gene_type:complete
MPQFDKITFFNQIFWLFIFFSGFYLISLKVFLPKLSSVLKARTKKLQKGSEGLTSFNEELVDVNTSFNSSIEEMSVVVKTSISDFKDKTDLWVDSAVTNLNKEELESSNVALEKALHKQIAVSYLLGNVKP